MHILSKRTCRGRFCSHKCFCPLLLQLLLLLIIQKSGHTAPPSEHPSNVPCPMKNKNCNSHSIKPHQTDSTSPTSSSTEAHSAAVRPMRLPSHGFHPPSAVGLPHPPPPSVPSANRPTSQGSRRLRIGFTDVHNGTTWDCPIVQLQGTPP